MSRRRSCEPQGPPGRLCGAAACMAGLTRKNEVPEVIGQAPGWSAQRFSPARALPLAQQQARCMQRGHPRELLRPPGPGIDARSVSLQVELQGNSLRPHISLRRQYHRRSRPTKLFASIKLRGVPCASRDECLQIRLRSEGLTSAAESLSRAPPPLTSTRPRRSGARPMAALRVPMRALRSHRPRDLSTRGSRASITATSTSSRCTPT